MKLAHRWRCGSLLVSLLTLGAPALAAPNLLSNPGFDTDLSSWTVVGNPGLQISFDPTLDAASSPTSGSAKVLHVTSSFSCQLDLFQCVPGITPGKTYDFGGSILIPSMQPPVFGEGIIDAAWRSGSACTGTRTVIQVPAGPVFQSTQAGSWVAVTSTGNIAPAGTQSLQVNIGVCTTDPASTVQVNFDDLFVQLGATLPPPAIDLILIVEGPIRPTPGGPVQYILRVQNPGPVMATLIRPGVYIPPGLSGVIVNGGGNYNAVNGFISWPPFDHIDVGGEQTFSFTLPDAPNATGFAVVAAAQGDTNYANNTVAFALAGPAPAIPALAPAMLGLLFVLVLGSALLSRRA
jgi:hypothetical protein